MPHLNHCHECDKPFTPNYQFRGDGLVAICDNCIEPTTADEHNKDFINKDDYDFIAFENKNMALFLGRLGYGKDQIDKICLDGDLSDAK